MHITNLPRRDGLGQMRCEFYSILFLSCLFFYRVLPGRFVSSGNLTMGDGDPVQWGCELNLGRFEERPLTIPAWQGEGWRGGAQYLYHSIEVSNIVLRGIRFRIIASGRSRSSQDYNEFNEASRHINLLTLQSTGRKTSFCDLTIKLNAVDLPFLFCFFAPYQFLVEEKATGSPNIVISFGWLSHDQRLP